MDSIQLKTKALQSKMYLTETHRLIRFIKEAIGSLCGATWTTFQVGKKSISAIKSPWWDPIRILGRILSGSWVGSYQDPVGSYQNASGHYRSFSVSSNMQSHCQRLKFPFSSE